MNNSAREYFKILKEIASVESRARGLQTEIDQENARITSVENQRNARLEYLQQLAQEEQQLESTLSDLESQMEKNSQLLARLKQNANSITSVKEQEALEHQQTTVNQQQEEFTNRSFEMLEKIEQIQTELDEAKSYSELSLKSLLEIKAEVDQITSKQNSELDALKTRIELLLGQLPENFQKAYHKVAAKNLKYGPFTSIKNLKCHICSFQIDRKTESDVQDQLLLKTCSSCSRIFIPDSALY